MAQLRYIPIVYALLEEEKEMKCLFVVIGVIIGLNVSILVVAIVVQKLRTMRRFVIHLKRYYVGNDRFMVSLYEITNQNSLRLYLIENGYLQCRHISKLMRQIRHAQGMAESIVSIVGFYNLRHIRSRYNIWRLDTIQDQIQRDIDELTWNVERFNEFMKQSKVIAVDDLDHVARELKEANQPILNHLSFLRKEVANNI